MSDGGEARIAVPRVGEFDGCIPDASQAPALDAAVCSHAETTLSGARYWKHARAVVDARDAAFAISPHRHDGLAAHHR